MDYHGVRKLIKSEILRHPRLRAYLINHPDYFPKKVKNVADISEFEATQYNNAEAGSGTACTLAIPTSIHSC